MPLHLCSPSPGLSDTKTLVSYGTGPHERGTGAMTATRTDTTVCTISLAASENAWPVAVCDAEVIEGRLDRGSEHSGHTPSRR